MIDKIDLRKNKLTSKEIRQIIRNCHLKATYRNGKTKYNNTDTSNFNGGLFIEIDYNNRLKVEGSVHKYYNYLKNNKLDNHNRFNLIQAKETIHKIIKDIGVLETGVMVRSYEIGINIILEFDVHKILDNLIKVGGRKIYINPKYKYEKDKTTDFHRDFRHVYKAYDKLYEMKERGRTIPKGINNLIRLEHKVRRLSKLTLTDFISLEYLQKIFYDFKTAFDKMEFKPNIKYIGSGYSSQIKVNTAKLIITQGKLKALEVCKRLKDIGETSNSNYRTQREFIRDWHKKELYKDYKKIQLNEYANLTYLLSIEYQALNLK